MCGRLGRTETDVSRWEGREVQFLVQYITHIDTHTHTYSKQSITPMRSACIITLLHHGDDACGLCFGTEGAIISAHHSVNRSSQIPPYGNNVASLTVKEKLIKTAQLALCGY